MEGAGATSGSRSAEQWLPSRPESVSEARRVVAAWAAPVLGPGREPELSLVVSEVVTNAVRHGSSLDLIELRVVAYEDFMRVEVTDAGPGLAPRPRATEPSADGGFGLFLIEQLTRRWGVVRQQQRTRVWFEFSYA